MRVVFVHFKATPFGYRFLAIVIIVDSTKKKVFLISLGCAKNLVDSENILGLLKERGFSVVSSLEEAQISIINTCGFIQSAVEECIETILEVVARKEKGELEKLSR